MFNRSKNLAKARVLDRAKRIQNTSNHYSNDSYLSNSQYPLQYLSQYPQYPQCSNPQYPQYPQTLRGNTIGPSNNQLVPRQTRAVQPVGCEPVDSSMCVLSNSPNGMKFHLASSLFDSDFNTKNITQVKMLNNLDGSVTFTLTFASSGNYPHYPSNPAYHNFIPPYDLDSPIFKGMHYFNVTSF